MEKPTKSAEDLKNETTQPQGQHHTAKRVPKNVLDDHIDPSLSGKPVDYSFRRALHLGELKNETPREFRVGLPKKDPQGKFISRSLWLNYNQLADLEDLKDLVSISFCRPEEISWLDISFNEIKIVSEDLLLLKNLKILYLHGNRIKYFIEVAKLKPLVFLRKLTLHGNPIEENLNYRCMVTKTLPQVIHLDFSLVSK